MNAGESEDILVPKRHFYSDINIDILKDQNLAEKSTKFTNLRNLTFSFDHRKPVVYTVSACV